MPQSYTIGGDAFYTLLEPNLNSQIFYPQKTHTLDYVDINLKCGPATASIFCAIYWGLYLPPFPGTPLAVSKMSPYPVAPGSVNRYRFDIKARPILKAGEVYQILTYQGRILIGTRAEILYDSAGATLPRGFRAHSEDLGVNWTFEYDQDTIFTEFGDPPLPIPQLSPPMSLWAPLGLYFYHCQTTEIIYLTTSVPCHLTCYLTEIEPTKHYLSRTIRGIKVPWTTRFSLNPWFSVEQSESGDTIYHTFQVANWPLHLKRWFSFRGEVDFKLSPSVGPIFKRTPTYHDPFQNGSFWEWPSPTYGPKHWKLEFDGPGPANWFQEEIDVKTPPYAVTLTTKNTGSSISLTQTACAGRYGGRTLNFDFWFRTVGYGQITISIRQTGPGAWSWTRHYGPTGWLHRNFNHYIHPNGQSLTVKFECRSVSGALATARFDGITISEV